MLHDFHAVHAFVNGGNTGIGRAVVLGFAGAGAAVTFVYHGGPDAHAAAADTVREAEAVGARVAAVEADSSHWDTIHAVIRGAVERLGPIDVLVNVAGITRDGMVWKLQEADWTRVMEVNAGSYFNCIHAVAQDFRARKRGRIINISSINGMRGKAGQANYAASKAAVIALTKTVARELGPSNVTVNAIAPGLILTPMTDTLADEVKARAIAETVLGRPGTAEDVAHAVLFLASEEARHITGAVLKVDGGQYM